MQNRTDNANPVGANRDNLTYVLKCLQELTLMFQSKCLFVSWRSFHTIKKLLVLGNFLKKLIFLFCCCFNCSVYVLCGVLKKVNYLYFIVNSLKIIE